MARTIQLDGEHRLPAPKHELGVLDQQRREAREQELAAVSVAVNRLVHFYFKASREIVVLVSGVAGREALQQVLEVVKEQGLVFIYCEAERRVQRLQVDPPSPQAGFPHLFAQPLGQVDEFGGTRSFESQPPGDHAEVAKA